MKHIVSRINSYFPNRWKIVLFENKLVPGEDHFETMNKIPNAPFGLYPQRLSFLTRLWRVTALALRFVRKIRKKSAQDGPLKAEENEAAEILWTKRYK